MAARLGKWSVVIYRTYKGYTRKEKILYILETWSQESQKVKGGGQWRQITQNHVRKLMEKIKSNHWTTDWITSKVIAFYWAAKEYMNCRK